MAGASVAHSPPTVQPPSTFGHRQQAADRCWPKTSSISRLYAANHHQIQISLPLRSLASASVRFKSLSGSSSGPQYNGFYGCRRLGFSLAASSDDDRASAGARPSEADPADKGWINAGSNLPEAGSHSQVDLNKDTPETTAESEKAAMATKAGVLKAEAPGKDDSSEPANKFMGALRDTTEELKEQAEKARAAFAVTAQETAAVLAATAQETAEKSKGNLSYIAENAPDPIREIADTALKAHSDVTPNKFAKIHDFCLGIPYGTILVIGGLLLFIVSGSTAPIRFGVMLGGILLALSVTSLSAWKEGKPTTTYILGQAVISAILALRQIRRLGEVKASFLAVLFTLTSAGMLGFYCYVLLAGGNPPSKKAKHAPSV